MIFITALSTCLLLFATAIALPWARNIRAAKATGLPYVIVPFFAYNRITSLFMLRIVIRIANKFLPAPTITSSRTLTTGGWPWKLQHAPFAELGDTFLTVAPGGIILNTADADVITEVISRGADFPKASHLYKTVNIYGENVLTAEGETWRRHRKILGPLFSEKNNQLVWKQTLEYCEEMLAFWTDGPNKAIRTLAKDTKKLSLNVIEHAGLGQHGESFSEGQIASKEKLQEGHTMSFHISLSTLLDHVLYIILLPKWFLRNAPFRVTHLANQSFCEWGTYMEESVAKKRATMEIEKGNPSANDVLSQLVRASEEGSTRKILTQSEISGNLFVITFAGHETSANSIHFSIILLALHPQFQKEVQQELDEMFKGRSNPSEWSYERDFPLLFESKLAAVLSEQLRLYAPTVALPKLSTSIPHQLMVDGKEVTVPPTTMVRLCLASMHRNPKFWDKAPSRQKSESGLDNDLHEFRPERWIKKDKISSATDVGTKAPQPHKKGAYLPFADGPRACLGRRFAQVEVLAALARILSEYSVELAVDDWATAEQVERMTEQEKAELWGKAEGKANWNLQNKTMVLISLQLRGAHVPVKVVKRGDEVFANI